MDIANKPVVDPRLLVRPQKPQLKFCNPLKDQGPETGRGEAPLWHLSPP